MRTAHAAYLGAMMSQAGLGKGGAAATWRHLLISLRKMLNAALRFAALQMELLNQREGYREGGDRRASSVGGKVRCGWHW